MSNFSFIVGKNVAKLIHASDFYLLSTDFFCLRKEKKLTWTIRELILENVYEDDEEQQQQQKIQLRKF